MGEWINDKHSGKGRVGEGGLNDEVSGKGTQCAWWMVYMTLRILEETLFFVFLFFSRVHLAVLVGLKWCGCCEPVLTAVSMV